MTVVTERPTWPETWMNVAVEISRRSCDPALKVGCVIVPEDNTAILGLGYNGMWRGGPNQVESLERGKSGTIHAEVNALIKCDFSFPKKKHLYVTNSPCRECAKLVINAGIDRVVYHDLYRDASPLELLRSVGIEVMSLADAILKAR
jgi:dCMP deaminase